MRMTPLVIFVIIASVLLGAALGTMVYHLTS